MPLINGSFYMDPAHGRAAEAVSEHDDSEEQGQGDHWVTIDHRHVLLQGTQAGRAQRSANTPAPRSVREEGNNVVIVYSDGIQEVRSGGSRSWRNNNPGNIRPGDFTMNHGAIGEAGRFAVFPNEGDGQAALESLLRTQPYQSRTVSEAIARYAPPGENLTRY
jgi:hypothetical protein